jgi:phage FluMu gp28-like protein
MRILSHKARFASRYIDLEAAAQVPGAEWEAFQIRFLNNTDRFDIEVKSRQIAWSFTAAVDAVVDGILNEDTPHIFVSINQDEAKEKIRYAKNIIEAMDPDKRPKLIQDSQTSLEFGNGSRLISHPCRPPRGKPRARVYYDEMAHYQSGLDREVYRAGLPATAKGDGYIRIGSSPLGATGLFWEIFTEAMRAYPGYAGHRIKIPWWHVRSLCKDVPEALKLASHMATEDRVRLFGTKPLVELYENMFIEDFQQEFECSWVDEAIAWISWDVIKRNQDPGLICWHSKSVVQARRHLAAFQQALDDGKVESSLAGGIDVGRKRDLTEFFIIGKSPSGSLPVRWMISLSQVEYDDQEGLFVELIKALPFVKVLVDETGIGSQLAENLRKRTGGVSEGQSFTQPAKEVWAVEARIQAERGNTPLPVDRDLAYQIHSIKKRMSATKHASFDTERNETHHADKFWAWALALYAGKSRVREFLKV